MLFLSSNQWYFSSLDHATISLLPHNKILDDIAKRTTDKPKGFLYCHEINKKPLRVYIYPG